MNDYCNFFFNLFNIRCYLRLVSLLTAPAYITLLKLYNYIIKNKKQTEILPITSAICRIKTRQNDTDTLTETLTDRPRPPACALGYFIIKFYKFLSIYNILVSKLGYHFVNIKLCKFHFA